MDAPPAPMAWSRLRRAPLVPVAAAFTLGLVLDRFSGVPTPVALGGTFIAILAWAISRFGRESGLSLVYLGIACVGLGAARHHEHLNGFDADDISVVATDEAGLVRVQGTLAEEPARFAVPPESPLRSQQREATSASVLAVTSVSVNGDWRPCSGRLSMHVPGHLEGLHVGDEVEVLGWIQKPQPAGNPGERDRAARLRDQRILAELSVRDAGGVVRLRQGWPDGVTGWLAKLRADGRDTLTRELPERQAGVACALLLGDTAALDSESWDRFARAGVVHVLAISGIHIGILASFVWFVLRFGFVRRRNAAVAVAVFVLLYALMTGGRPPAMRAAFMVCLFCGGILMSRPAMPANVLAAAWLGVTLLDPTQPFSVGCQLSFIATGVLLAIGNRVGWHRPHPLEQLADEARPWWSLRLRGFVRFVIVLYLINTVIAVAVIPLIAHGKHLISPAALLIGPPVVVLSSLALVSGFLLLIASPLTAEPFATITSWLLSAVAGIVEFGNALPGGFLYLDGPPVWWLLGFYGVLAVWLVWDHRNVPIWRWAAGGLLAWLVVGLAAPSLRPADGELRVTFLDVGHGCCAVIQTPDGRALLYDAGSLAGPEVATRRIAPFLWANGVGRIDEVFLSHADLDHFNGLPDLLDRFAVGQVTMTPSFGNKDSPAARLVMDRLRDDGVAVREAKAGDRFHAGELTMDVLHPPSADFPGDENARSLVLLLRHEGHTILLTGDLVDAGLAHLTDMPKFRPDVLMAPHHGSRASNTEKLADWAEPNLVISTQTWPRWPATEPDPYAAKGIRLLGTHEHGAVTIRSHSGGLTVETFRTNQRWAVGAAR